MGRRGTNGKCENNKNGNGRAGKSATSDEGKGPKSGNAVTQVVMPDNLEDYKGARKKLRHAVKAVVKANSETLAEKIVEKAQGGDVRGAEMMLSLIDKKKPGKEGKKKKREGPSWVELLVSEPEWDEEDEKKAALGTERPRD